MKVVFVGLTLIVVLPHFAVSTTGNGTRAELGFTTQSASYTSDEVGKKVESNFFNIQLLRNILIERFRSWKWNEDDKFTGRCLQLAKKIRSLIPIAVFKMGVIMTLLGFLTLFSLKSLGLLIVLLLINTSGAVAKITAAFFTHKEQKHSSGAHYHFHKDDDHYGSFHKGHIDHGYDWDRKLKINQELMDLDRMESYNLYNKLLGQLASKNYKI